MRFDSRLRLRWKLALSLISYSYPGFPGTIGPERNTSSYEFHPVSVENSSNKSQGSQLRVFCHSLLDIKYMSCPKIAIITEKRERGSEWIITGASGSVSWQRECEEVNVWKGCYAKDWAPDTIRGRNEELQRNAIIVVMMVIILYRFMNDIKGEGEMMNSVFGDLLSAGG